MIHKCLRCGVEMSSMPLMGRCVVEMPHLQSEAEMALGRIPKCNSELWAMIPPVAPSSPAPEVPAENAEGNSPSLDPARPARRR